MPQELNGNPVYTGMAIYRDNEGGYEICLPSNWAKVDLTEGHHGWLFTPYPDDYNTCLIVEKHKLEITVTPEDIDILREAFYGAVEALPGVEIESKEESLSDSINIFEARYSFMEGENRRKRWVRNTYWGNGQLVLMAQGRTPEDFDHWLPMFYNTMVTTRVV